MIGATCALDIQRYVMGMFVVAITTVDGVSYWTGSAFAADLSSAAQYPSRVSAWAAALPSVRRFGRCLTSNTVEVGS